MIARHAERFAAVALDNVAREYPNKLDHVLAGPADLRPPRALHPAFYGSYDWHSCVHMHWLLARVRRAVPQLPQRNAIGAVFDAHFAPQAIAAECAYLARPDTQSFERTYGWAWLLKLAAELALADDEDARRWSRALAPLAEEFVARYHDYLPKAHYPIRHGNHPNSAFGLAFALDYASVTGNAALAAVCSDAARDWFAADRDAPVAYEPSGADFLSPTLTEAELMHRVLPRDDYARWLDVFLPGLGRQGAEALYAPATVADRSDPQIVHLDGLNLSRAWCLAGIAAALPEGDGRAASLRAAADRHVAAGMAGIDAGHYVGAHWLATFALLALDR